jgi:hypothetical protein
MHCTDEDGGGEMAWIKAPRVGRLVFFVVHAPLLYKLLLLVASLLIINIRATSYLDLVSPDFTTF